MRLFFHYILAAAVLIAAWKALSVLVSSAVLPPPETAFAAFEDAVKTWAFWSHFAASALRVTSAMALAWLVAFPLGLWLGTHQRSDELLSPLVFLTYPIPKIVLLPVFLVLFGLGDVARVAMIALIIGYQVLVATRDAAAGLDQKYLDSFRSLGGAGMDTLRHVMVPAALPGGFTALRIGTGTGVAVLFFLESFATSRGLGFLIMDAWGRFVYDQMFVGILGMSLLGVGLYEVVNYLERTICAWRFLESSRSQRALQRGDPITLRVKTFGRMIKFSHTLFALPFALAAVVLAQRGHDLSPGLLLWILVAMIGARSAAMGFNRIADIHYDRINPRTAERALATGALSMKTAVLLVVLFSALFVFAAVMISRLCFLLSFPVLAILFSYSYTKRYTAASHLVLGFAISLAPLGAWIAVTGAFQPGVLVLSAALLTYIAGFDILYACQDVAFDRKARLFSIPAQFGVRVAFRISELLHAISFVFLFLVMVVFDLGGVYLAALFVIGALLVSEHRLVKPDDLKRLHVAFFHVNSAVSVVLFLGVFGDELLRALG